MGKYKHMVIRFTLGGAIVKIGCKRIPFTSREDMKRMFCDYIDDPEDTEKALLADDWAIHGEDQTSGIGG